MKLSQPESSEREKSVRYLSCKAPGGRVPRKWYRTLFSRTTLSDDPPGQPVHRIALLTVCLAWPLIWVGGLVTTSDAGMAVPDWPSTYGYNLFLYPFKSWLFGPFDLFIEHGHRLLAALVGFVAIGLVIAAFLLEPRRWVRWLTVGVLGGVIAQGVLGGMRVLLDDRTLAMLHGCIGPASFALCVVAAVVTSRWWWRVGQPLADPTRSLGHGRPLGRPRPLGRGAMTLSIGLVAISYGQLVLGAQLRHVQPTATPDSFAHTVALHVVTALLLWLLAGWVWWCLRRCGDLTLSRPGVVLIGLVGLQIALGVGTWVVKYGYPGFLDWVPGATDFVIRSKAWGGSLLITAHVGTGSLILAVATMTLVRLLRYRAVGLERGS